MTDSKGLGSQFELALSFAKDGTIRTPIKANKDNNCNVLKSIHSLFHEFISDVRKET